jgi:hypothetical protein
MMSADFPPTDAQLEVTKELNQELAAAQSQLDDLIAHDLMEFNKFLSSKGLEGIVAPKR